MYIKEIKINGFKSFADKTNMELLPTFTGIVGPNGSGKSNIVDAIKWVLGEQSIKNLRGANNMADVIFSGSKSRDASRSASVALVFDNSDKVIPLDYTEVMIKRTIYSTGENEYSINNERCRLKDITDLFLDSFAGKETFNIIAQGKVSEILSNKPEDRRIILEEAAGVLKYKKRKEDSLRKLAKTHENISRIDMIIDELYSQVEPLKEQSEKATEYKNLKSELESIDIALIAKDITISNTSYKNNKERIDILKDEISISSTNTSKEETKIEELKLKKIKLDEQITKSQSDLLSYTNQLSDLSKKLELAKERTKYDKNDNNIKEKLILLKEEHLKIKNDIDSTQKDIDLINKEKETISVDKTKNNDEYKQTDTLYKLKQEEIQKINKKEYELKSKIEILENNILASAKTPYSVRTVLNNPLLDGIENTIANVIETEQQFSTMLDIALGASANFVIVKDDKSARDAIKYLKENNKGRVTFYPLNVIKPKSIEPTLLEVAKQCSGYINIAANMVKYDKKYYNIIMNQLGNVIVADNILNAQKISNQISHKYKVVTLDGDILNVGGSVTGGSISKQGSVITEKYELERLQDELKNTINNKETSEIKLNELLNELNIIRDNIYKASINETSIIEKLRTKNNYLDELKSKEESIKTEIKDLSLDTKEKIDSNISNLVDEYYKLEQKKNTLEKDIEYNIKNKKDIEQDINDKEQEIKKYNTKQTNEQNELKDLEIKNSKLEIILDNLLNRLNEEYSITYELASSSDKYELNIDENEARLKVSELKKRIKLLGNINLDSIEEYERVNKRYVFLTSQKDDLLISEQNILEIINNMDDVMIDKFATTFHKVNKEFNNVFKVLFNGGNAELKLTNPENLLETGLEIIANPPGKKPTNISLLSGGEKTLTAISLLFSIMNLKKVPFVILDEVESALDEANVDRFGKYIDNYKNKTQLLIITHKKKTMEYVDLLYGITMQESGVSKLVSVKLEDIKKEN